MAETVGGLRIHKRYEIGSNNRIARLIIKKADFSKYSMDELSDAANYLYGKDVSQINNR